jgi:hypothetical protein
MKKLRYPIFRCSKGSKTYNEKTNAKISHDYAYHDDYYYDYDEDDDEDDEDDYDYTEEEQTG